MKRRTYLKTMLAGAGAKAALAQQKKGAPAERPIELFLDLAVDPAKEQEMLRNFNTQFKPTAMKQPGFIFVKLLKLRQAIQGSAPAGTNYRFAISFHTEAQRLAWVATADHQRLWPLIENMLSNKNYSVLLYE